MDNETEWRAFLAVSGVNPVDVEFDQGTGTVHFKALGLRISRERNAFFITSRHAYRWAHSLATEAGARFGCSDTSEVTVSIGGITAVVQSEEDLYILREIFLEGVYNASSPRDAVVCDIGMNVGFASLFLSAKDFVKAVYGYEPFKPTYNQALRNFELNPTLRKKISPNNFGLGGSDRSLTAEFCYDYKGGSSIVGSAPDARGKGLTIEQVQIRRASDAIRSIKRAHPDCDLIVKLDCEGAEYEIVDELVESGALGLISAFMVEWHLKGYSALVTKLNDAGFLTISRNVTKPFGAMYAFKGNQ